MLHLFYFNIYFSKHKDNKKKYLERYAIGRLPDTGNYIHISENERDKPLNFQCCM